MQKNLLLIAMALALLASGCGPDGISTEATEEIEPTEERGYQFIFVCPILDNEYWETCVEGIERADAELGTSTRVIGPEDATDFSTEIIGYMEEAVAAAPDGILGYAGIEGLFPLIHEASEQGIPFVAVDSDAPDTERVAYVGTDSYLTGYEAGEAMVQLSGGEAKIGVLLSSLNAAREVIVLDAFKDAIADYDMEVLAVEETDADPDVAEEKARKLLEQYPEITAIFNTAGYNVTGAARVKEELGRDDLILVGFDDTEENFKFVRAGVIDALIVQDPEQMGYKGVYLLKEYLDKGVLPRDIYSTATVLVTQENADSYRD